MCERAYFSFNLAKRGNQIRVLEKAAEERDAAATEAERNAASRLLTIKKETEGASSDGLRDSVLDADVRVGTKVIDGRDSLTKIETKADPEVGTRDVEAEQEIRDLRRAVEELTWKLEREHGAHKGIVELLEDKVAAHLVKIAGLEKEEAKWRARCTELEAEIPLLQAKIKAQCDQMQAKKIKNEKLRFKI